MPLASRRVAPVSRRPWATVRWLDCPERHMGSTTPDATGHVSAVDDSLAGGLAGLSLGVNRSYATGAVTVTGRNGIAGGLLGRVDGIVWNSYATGSVDTGRGGEAGSLAGLYAG